MIHLSLSVLWPLERRLRVAYGKRRKLSFGSICRTLALCRVQIRAGLHDDSFDRHCTEPRTLCDRFYATPWLLTCC